MIEIVVWLTISAFLKGGTNGSKKRKEFYSEVDQIAEREAFIESVQEGFKEVQDPRAQDNQRYSLVNILIIILCAILAGANTIVDISDYARLKIDLFRHLLKIEKVPSYNVFWWLLTRLDPKQLEHCFIFWIQSLPDEDKKKLIAIDGKHIRGAARAKKIHLVSAWDTNRSLLLGQVKAREKSNEITAIPELIDSLDLKGSLPISSFFA